MGTSFFTKKNIKYCDNGISNTVTLSMLVTGTTKLCTKFLVAVGPANYNARVSGEAGIYLLNHKHITIVLHYRQNKLHGNNSRTKVISHNSRALLSVHSHSHQLFIWLSSWATLCTPLTPHECIQDEKHSGSMTKSYLIYCLFYTT
jgi:hypothetical protein